MTRSFALSILTLASVALSPLAAHAQVSVSSSAFGYTQNFDSLATSGSTDAWSNDSTLTGWSLFNFSNAPLTTYAAGDGSSNTGAFYSFGASGSSQRALGGVGSGGAYFGSAPSGAIAGYIAVGFTNDSGQTLSGFTLGFDGEQWRNGGNTSAQTMVLEYGFGSSFATVSSWSAPGGNFDWTSPVTGATAAPVDGTTAGLVAGRGGHVDRSWSAGQTLWVRWDETNDFGNDHGLAIDNFTLNVAAVPEPASWLLALAGLVAMGLFVRRRGER